MIDTKHVAEQMAMDAVNNIDTDLIRDELYWRGVPRDDLGVLIDEVVGYLDNMTAVATEEN